MRSLKLIFGGPNQVSVDWNDEVNDVTAVAQKATVAVMTHAGSDRFIPSRGTEVASRLFSSGMFDLLSMQHILNFGALKANEDVVAFEDAALANDSKLSDIRLSLISVTDNTANIGVVVTAANGESTTEITKIQ